MIEINFWRGLILMVVVASAVAWSALPPNESPTPPPPAALRQVCVESCKLRHHAWKISWTGEAWDCYCLEFSAYPGVDHGE